MSIFTMLTKKDSLLTAQSRILGALFMRELRIRYGRHNIGFLWIILEPMLFTLGVTAFWSIMGLTHNSALPITAFALTGYSSVLLWRNAVSRCGGAIRSNSSLLYHRQIRMLHLLLTPIMLEISGVLMSFIVLSLIFVSTGLMSFPANIFKLFLGLFFLAWFGAGLALFIGTITQHSEVVERLWHTISYLLFPASGAGFMVEWLPKDVQAIFLWFPMVNGVELVRDGIFGSVVRTHYSIPYMVIFCAILTLLALAVIKKSTRYVQLQ